MGTSEAVDVSKAGYMAEVAASAQGSAVRDRVLAALDLRPGQVVLDVGCGPGVNLRAMAATVTATGAVIGVDCDPVMLAEAARRTAVSAEVVGQADWPGADGPVRLLHGDAHALPLGDGTIDRARTDRMLQHVADPAAAIAELRRITRPGGLACLSEPDWATLAVDSDDLTASAAFTRYTCAEVVRNASVGRQLARLADAAGFAIRSVTAQTPLWRDFREADAVLRLSRNSVRAAQAGYLTASQAQSWLYGLRNGPFLATAMLFTVVAQVPG